MHKILISHFCHMELIFHDDAVAVYLNGQLITSADMPDEKHENNLYYAGVSAGAPKEASVVLTKDQLKAS